MTHGNKTRMKTVGGVVETSTDDHLEHNGIPIE